MAVASGLTAALAFAGLFASAGTGCQPVAAGISASDAAELPAPAADAAAAGDDASVGPADAFEPFRRDAAKLVWEPPDQMRGPPDVIGCADGTREGFVDPKAWQDIAGCAGAWTLPGLQGQRARSPQCGRASGNGGDNPRGINCSVADLCAEGWRVCEDSDDVAASSPTGCESAAPPGFAAFFLVRGGASWSGVCGPQNLWFNDLHGCGSYGRSESQDCAPLSRRLGFADCTATDGVWLCGDPQQHLEEGQYVTKNRVALGGALCCRAR